MAFTPLIDVLQETETKVAKKDLASEVMGYLVNDKGLRPEIAAGMAGNIYQEARFNPNAVNPKSGAFGFFQHLGSRKKGLFDFAAKRGTAPTDWKTQVDFALHELETDPSWGWSHLQKATEPGEAASIFSKKFERAGKHETNDAARIKFARDIHSNWNLNQSGKMFAGPGAVEGDGFVPLEKALAIEQNMPKGFTPLEESLGQAASVVPVGDPKQRAKQEILQLLGADPLGEATRSIVDLPHKVLVAPLVKEFVDKPLERMGVPAETAIPVESLQGEGLTFPLSGETIQAPVRGLATGLVGGLADIPVYNTALKWSGKALRSLARPEPAPTLDLLPVQQEMKASSSARAIQDLAVENTEIQRAYDALHGFSKVQAEPILGRAAVERQVLIDQLTGTSPRTLPSAFEGQAVGRVLPRPKFPASQELEATIAKIEGQSYPGLTAAEKLTPAKTEPVLAANQRELQQLQGKTWVGSPTDEKMLREFYGGGTKKYYSGGPDVEDIGTFLNKEINVKGTSTAAAITNASKKFGLSPEEVMKVVKASSRPLTPGTVDNIASEIPIITKQFTTEIDSTLGPKGTVVDTIPLTEADVAVRNSFTGKDISKPFLMGNKWDWTFKTSERIWSELDQAFPGIYNRLYWPFKEAENTAYNATKAMFAEVDKISAGLPKGAGERIGIDQIARRQTGLVRLQKMGKNIEPLTPQEKEAAEKLRQLYTSYIERVNKARALAGKQPIHMDDNYIPFMINYIERINEGANPILSKSSIFNTPTETSFRFKHRLTGSSDEVALDAFDIVKNYGAQAEKHINISPQLERLNKFTGEIEGKTLGEIAPNANAAMQYMGRAISGVKEPMNRMERWLTKASDNLVISTLGAYPRSVINQSGALAAAAGETGINNLRKGLTEMLSPGSWKEAHQLSRVLSQRKMDVVLEDLWGSQVGQVAGKLKHGAMVPLEVMDDFIATAVWRGAMNKAKGMGFKGKDAVRFADSVVVRTQASASPIDRAMVQNLPLGRVATAFQTFAIADANYIARNIFGRGNVNWASMAGLKKLATMSMVGMGLNYLQRELIGMPAGLPEPLAKGLEAIEEGQGPVGTLTAAAKEFAPLVPVMGSIAFGKAPGGAIGSLVSDYASGFKGPYESLAMLAGVPGMNLMQRGLKTQEGRELTRDFRSELNLPIKKSTTEPMTWGEVFLGREPKKKSTKKGDLDTWMERNF